MSLAMSRKERETFLADLHVGIVSIPDGDQGPLELGDAELERDVRPIAHRYLGAEVGDGYLEATRESGAGRDILVRIRPERWLTVDYSKQFQVPSSESET